MSFSFTKTRKSGGLFDNDDCERPACDDIKKALPSSTEELQAMSQKLASKKKVQCPPRSAELGRSSWKLLHSMVRVCVCIFCWFVYHVLTCMNQHFHLGRMVSRKTNRGPTSTNYQFYGNFGRILSLYMVCL